MIYFAPNLLYLRKQKGLTQAEMCSQIDVQRSSLSYWENGQAVPDLARLLDLCKFFDVSLNELITANLSEGKLINHVKTPKNTKKSNVGTNPIYENYPSAPLLSESETTYKTTLNTLQIKDKMITQLQQIIDAQAATIETMKAAIEAANEEITRLRNNKK